ncbi:prepilin-type N-terminal cleavage/methylation domain-containing protein [Phytopseudomonas daroniae]|uniref:prepilin-type N-terminal cleavage/methylation domain-containing protein n=1 Tax=Phytopseudomonas daroniae TaxID=2487519 RepID=UPI00103832A2|nr:prepilin-type N-terminal cleavage/methylation domain-containing protein [Pseudomonas daroniae]TBU74086.1 general secretion pathway protein GspI [Pseudomonas daroniae]
MEDRYRMANRQSGTGKQFPLGSVHIQSGFTLIELLAATALLAVGFTVMITAMGQVLHALAKSNLRTQVAMLASSLIESETRGRQEVGLRQGREGELEWWLNTRLEASEADISLYRLELVVHMEELEERFTTLRVQQDRFVGDEG